MHDSIDDTASGRIMGGKGKSGLKTQLTILSSNAGFASVLAAQHNLARITVSACGGLSSGKAAARRAIFGCCGRQGFSVIGMEAQKKP